MNNPDEYYNRLLDHMMAIARERDESYNRLHDHMMAIARERDWYKSEVDRLTDELELAHEALRRQMP
jgi:hypothetical protein